MNPHKMNKVDISSMSEQDQKAFKMYGKVPGKNLLTKMQKDRKYFDSGDYMMSKAGVASAQAPGTAIPTPEGVPHASAPNTLATSPHNTSPPITSPTHEYAPFAQLEKVTSNDKNNVGVGISPAATSDAMEVPGGQQQGHHGRRPSDSQARVSPPATMRENSTPSSSYPIHHAHSGGLGTSPVKTSNLRRSDGDVQM